MKYDSSFEASHSVRNCTGIVHVRYMSFERPHMKIVTTLLLCVFLSSIVSADQVTPSNAVTRHVNVRSLPSSNGKIIAELFPGERADLMNIVDDWLEVRLSDGRRGFVSKSWTIVLDDPVDSITAIKDTTLIQQIHVLSDSVDMLTDSVDKLGRHIDSLTKYIENIEIKNRNYTPSKDTNILPFIFVPAAALVLITIFFTTRLSQLKEKRQTKGQKKARLRRRAYFVVSTPRIEQTHGTFCSLSLSLINSGDNPAVSFNANMYIVDVGISQTTLYREFHFSSANPIGSQKDVTFSEENIDFTSECAPKFVCIEIEYYDNTLKKKFRQEFTFKWKGVKFGRVRVEFEPVDKERSIQVWLNVKELKRTTESSDHRKRA